MLLDNLEKRDLSEWGWCWR